MKVIGVGYPKTGTKTLGECFRILGLRNTSWDVGRYKAYEAGKTARLVEFARDYQSFEDLPWCLLYRELDQAFPGSKFILTVRSNEKRWYDSERIHRATYVDDEWMLRSGEVFDKVISGYRAHNLSVCEYFRDRPGDLLEVCWERDDQWSELCNFLDAPLPKRPFPHKNKRRSDALSRFYIGYLKRLGTETAPLGVLETVMAEVMEDLGKMSLAEVAAIRDALGDGPNFQRWWHALDREIEVRG